VIVEHGRPAEGLPDLDQIEIFRSFLTAHAQITRTLDEELIAEHQLSLADFDVFVQLAERPGRSARMTELAEALLISRSGATRLIERLEKEGMVTRGRANGDGRGVSATLTDQGLRRFREASATHLRGIQRHFLTQLSAVEMVAIGQVCQQLIHRPRDEGPA
jgi:DNA-binding MarR family transcriptional regulator